MLTPRKKKSPLPEKFSSEENRTQDAASSRTARPTHHQRAIASSRTARSTHHQRAIPSSRTAHPPPTSYCIKQDSAHTTNELLHQAGQRTQHTTNELLRPKPGIAPRSPYGACFLAHQTAISVATLPGVPDCRVRAWLGCPSVSLLSTGEIAS